MRRDDFVVLISDQIAQIMTPEEQARLLKEAETECALKKWAALNSSLSGGGDAEEGHCEMTWDNVLCWDPTPPGTLARQPCPHYIHGFDTRKYATRLCTENGSWYFNPLFNTTWSDYRGCIGEPDELEGTKLIAERLKMLYTAGYGVSLFSLSVAIVIMLCCRQLKSKSNVLHINLFLSFILRAFLSFLKDFLFVEHLGLEKDVRRDNITGHLEFIEEGPHWECRLLTALFTYSIAASQIWIFMEGLYLHMLIYRTLSAERRGVKIYVILGWLLPVTFVGPWSIVKVLFDNKYCWNMSSKPSLVWIVRAPMMASVVINFIFFLDILRVLCSRVRATQRHMGRTKYRRLAKFILVLIPLFGVLYIVMYIAFPQGQQEGYNIAYLYIEMTYNSFQGFILALLFCFLNEEVHAEIKRVWYRRKSRRGDSFALTRSFALSSVKRTSYCARPPRVATPRRKVSTATINDNVKTEDFFTKVKSRALHLLACSRASSEECRVTPAEPGGMHGRYGNHYNSFHATNGVSGNGSVQSQELVAHPGGEGRWPWREEHGGQDGVRGENSGSDPPVLGEDVEAELSEVFSTDMRSRGLLADMWDQDECRVEDSICLQDLHSSGWRGGPALCNGMSGEGPPMKRQVYVEYHPESSQYCTVLEERTLAYPDEDIHMDAC